MNRLHKFVMAFEKIETPFYFYDLDLLRQTLETVKKYALDYNFSVHYALKANTNDKILRIIQSYGLGADCVSGNEVKRALECGFSPNHLVFAGVGKTDKEMLIGLENDIFCFNCESVQEIEVLNGLATQTGKIANIALRLNPNVEADTHKYITTGLNENKFGINLSDLDAVMAVVQQSSNINLIGIHFHIGSQIQNLNNFQDLCLKINDIQTYFDDRNINLHHINVGGGLGVNYQEPDRFSMANFDTYFSNFHQLLKRREGQEVHFELGRSIVAQCGSLISRVVFIKNGTNKKFAIIDAGMTELIRPALYQAYHQVDNLILRASVAERYDVVGPICESSDCFLKDADLPYTERGDLLAIRSAGAYGEVMTSYYNLRDKAKTVYSDDI